MRGKTIVGRLRRQLYLSRRRNWILVAAILAVVAVLIIVRSGVDERRGIQDFEAAGGGISEMEARDMAFAEATKYGLEEPPDIWIARQIDFGQYATLAGEPTKAFFGTPDYSPSAVVWVVSMRGDIRAPLLEDVFGQRRIAHARAAVL